MEEVGVEVDLVSAPIVVIDVAGRRVDVAYRCRVPAPASEPVTSTSAEIVEVGWFARAALPVLQSEVADALARLDAERDA
jgi:hypothetical protein